ncbi:hypothetical protein ACRRTK_004161 [Alexandromys fortis]
MEELKEDVKFIVDETLDFGGLSPSDSHEEEDLTVLVSPEKPLRRGLSRRTNPNTGAPALQSVRFSLGPLSPEKLEEILDEANRLAAQLEECALQDREGAGAGPGKPSSRGKPSPRRETFVLKDSPVRDLLPTVSSWSTPSPSSLAGLRSSDKKGSTRAAGKKLPVTKKGIAHLQSVPCTQKPSALSSCTINSSSPAENWAQCTDNSKPTSPGQTSPSSTALNQQLSVFNPTTGSSC